MEESYRELMLFLMSCVIRDNEVVNKKYCRLIYNFVKHEKKDADIDEFILNNVDVIHDCAVYYINLYKAWCLSQDLEYGGDIPMEIPAFLEYLEGDDKKWSKFLESVRGFI